MNKPAVRAGRPVPVDAGPIHVLLVEDDDGDALLVEELLADGLPGAILTRADTLDGARRLARASTDCVLVDLGLPDSDGLGAVSAILSVAPGAAVVVLTGAENEDLGVRAVAAGAQDYLVKGLVDERALSRSVRYAMERRRAQVTAQKLFEAERQRVENTRIERALLPVPAVSSSDVALSVRYRPGRDGAQLGGDFYDAIELDDGTLHVVIGDVAGHGPDEAALGVRLRSAWRALTLAGLSLVDLCRALDAFLRTETDVAASFSTMCSVRVARDRSRAELVLAGHPAPLLLAGTTRPVGEGRWGPPLGIATVPAWDVIAVELPQRWGLLLFTDGLFEGRLRPGGAERLGEVAVAAIVDEHAAEGGGDEQLLDDVLDAVVTRNGGPLHDDVALCLVRHTGDG